MKQETIEQIPFMERKHFVEEACLMFRKMIETKDKFLLLDKGKKLDLKKYDGLSIFEKIVKLLNKHEALIIKNDFIDHNEDPEWYLDHWCKTSYYKYKHDAINKFLYLLFS